jgi:hypothetical protein
LDFPRHRPAPQWAGRPTGGLFFLKTLEQRPKAFYDWVFDWVDLATLFTRMSCMAERSRYQDRIIKNYYENQDSILLQRLGELVTDLYLAEGKARQRLWARAQASLEKLKLPPARIAHLVKSDNPALLANLVKELMEPKR